MTAWAWVIGGPPPTGVLTRELATAYGRTVTWRLDGPATAQFSLNGRGSDAALIARLATDLTIMRDGVALFRGRIGSEADEITPSGHTSSFAATDYRGMLARRLVGIAGATYTATAAGAIAWNLVTTTQATTAGNWAITAGVGTTTGTVRDRTIDAAKPIVETIDEMGRLDNGYEWEIDAGLVMNLWHPRRGSATGVVLDYGGLVASVRRELDPHDYANKVIVTGSSNLTPVTADSATLATDPTGRLELSASYSTIIESATLNDRSLWLLAQAQILRPTYSLVMRPGRWGGKAHVWLGDTVSVQVVSGRLSFRESHRIVEVSIQQNDDGGEVVTLGTQLA